MYIKILIWIYNGYSTKTFISKRVRLKQCTTKTLKQIQFAINVLKSIDDSRLRSERMEQLINELFKLEFFKKIPQPPPSCSTETFVSQRVFLAEYSCKREGTMSFPNEIRDEKLKQVREIVDELKTYRDNDVRSILMEYYVHEFFGLELFKNSPVPPSPSGVVVRKRYVIKLKSCDYDFNVFRRIVGPNGTTVQAIERFSGCRLVLTTSGTCTVRINIHIKDYENTVKWRYEKVTEAINYVIANENFQVTLNQKAEQAVRVAYRKLVRESRRNRGRIISFNQAGTTAAEDNDDDLVETESKAILVLSGDEIDHNFHMYIKILIWIYNGYSTKTFISKRVRLKQCTTKTVLTMCSHEHMLISRLRLQRRQQNNRSLWDRCQLRLVNPNENPLRIKLIAKGYENIANWRIHKAIEGIQCVLTNDQYEVSLNQLAELAVRRGIHEKSPASYRHQVNTFLSHSGVVNVEDEEDHSIPPTKPTTT
ncbi:hypothetical protein T07_10548 [Trichinella nelsoni]|uniref:K Homology domain-containing protein n=1 Tax=Trichinella nelsoni TaxID=6336 RepID=A0A0V0SC41_9BILA|nr:hypothetical protein T07_10548 [Trichinella nelsoni]